IEEKALLQPTPAGESQCPGWMRRGFSLWKALDRWGFEHYPLAQGPRMTIETRAEAGFALMLGHAPYPAASLEGRLQRQMALHQQDLPLTDPMDVLEDITPYRLLQGRLELQKISPSVELNAWLAAWTAWLTACKPGRIKQWGTAEEGVIVLPNRIAS
ncbi:MAG TPA: hypothetical protein VHO48_10635, partial [Anaerolineaceae bacterium]|nr:hypothetical protein [Anaerolineaceae bacterium]